MKKVLIAAVIVVLAAAVAATAMFARKRDTENIVETAGQAVNSVEDTSVRTDIMVRRSIEEKSEGRFELDNITNVLLIGMDNTTASTIDSDALENPNDRGNADGILLICINADTQQLTLSSFMRDTKVRQPGGYERKLTTIYHNGGPKLLVEAMEQAFEIHIDNYILVNYLNVIDIIDTLGGMDITLSRDEISAMAIKISQLERLKGIPIGQNRITVDQAGEMHLNGLQTAAYMRIRPRETYYDTGRTQRARTVVLYIFDRVKSMKTAEKSSFAEKFMPMVQTDMSDTEILAFSASASTFMKFEVYQAKIPLDGEYTTSDDGNYYVIPDFEINNRYLYESIYEGKH